MNKVTKQLLLDFIDFLKESENILEDLTIKENETINNFLKQR